MSRENVEIVRKALDALNPRDTDLVEIVDAGTDRVFRVSARDGIREAARRLLGSRRHRLSMYARCGG